MDRRSLSIIALVLLGTACAISASHDSDEVVSSADESQSDQDEVQALKDKKNKLPEIKFKKINNSCKVADKCYVSDECRNKKGDKKDKFRDCFMDCLDDKLPKSSDGKAFVNYLDDLYKACKKKDGKGEVKKCAVKEIKNQACEKAFD